MAISRFNDEVSFNLPYGYELVRDFNDDGDEIVSIKSGSYINDDGEQAWNYNCRLAELTITRDDVTKDTTFKEMWEKVYSETENLRYAYADGAIPCCFMTFGQPMLFLGRQLNLAVVMMLVATGSDKFISLISTYMYKEDEPELTQEKFEHLLVLSRAIRVNGQTLDLGPVDAEELASALEPCFDGREPIDTGFKFQINVEGFGETTTYEYGSSSTEPVITRVRLNTVTPDKKLYPHYDSLLNNPLSGLGMLGVNVVVNSTGTEYSFEPLSSIADQCEDEDNKEAAAMMRRIISADTGNYSLAPIVWKMMTLFRVDEDVFDYRHDRENEISSRLLHRAYMMSALRSFAWTVADKCEQKGCEPEDLSFGELNNIIEFISGHNWLNYDETHCKGLCGCPDLHVYYVPDRASSLDKRKLLPNAEQQKQIDALKAKGFNHIDTTVHSLDELRKDLEYIFPAIETIYVKLANERDRSEALTGDEADILYAWCSLALAAKEPFFTEDGPMNCWFTQITNPIVPYTPSSKAKENAASVEEDSIIVDVNEDDEDDGPKDLPAGVHRAIDGYAVINNDWAVQLPDDWVWSTDSKHTGDKPFASVAEDQYDSDYPMGYNDDCFVVFQQSENSGAMGAVSLFGNMYGSSGDAVVDNPGLRVTFNHRNQDGTTYCQYVVVTTNRSTYIAQLFFTGGGMTASKRLTQVKKILKSICLVSDMPKAAKKNNKTTTKGSTSSAAKGQSSENAAPVKKKEARVPDPSVKWSTPTEAEMPIAANGIINDYSGNAKAIIIPNKAKTIDDFAFSGKSFTHVFVSDSVKSIGKGAFRRCNNLTSISLPEDLRSFGAWAFANGGLTSVSIPGNVKSIAENAFCECRQLTSVTITDGVTDIGEGAFWDCSSLTSVDLPNSLVSISRGAFYGCSSLPSVTIPSSVTTIGIGAFADCSSLTKITIPSSVKSIGNDVFSGCDKLTVYCPSGSYAEKYCKDNSVKCVVDDAAPKVRPTSTSTSSAAKKQSTNTTTPAKRNAARVPDPSIKWTTPTKDELFILDSGVTLRYEGIDKAVIVPKGVETIGGFAFHSNATLTHVFLPEGVKRINSSAFKGCTNLKSVSLPNSLTTIEDNAFSNCESLSSITIPDSVKTIDESAFADCVSLTSITIPSGVATVYSFTFSGCSGLTKVTIPSSVTSIYYGAFNDCKSLTEITIPDSVTTIGDYTFSNCESLTEITIPDGVTTIGKNAFSGCESLTEITIPDSVTTIGESAFYGCKSLTEITIPDSVTTIGDYTFSNCESLTEITIPDGVTTIGKNAFSGCESLTEITIPDRVTEIGDWAFRGCSSLTEITIPDRVTAIGDWTFSSCESLTTIIAPQHLVEKLERETYCKVITTQENQSRKAYNEAKATMDKAENEREFRSAARLFSTIASYKDAASLRDRCINEADRLQQIEEAARNQRAYEAAKNAMDNAKTEAEFRAVAQKFSSIALYQDASALRDQCLNTAERLQQIEEAARNQRAYEAAKEVMDSAKTEAEFRAAAQMFSSIVLYKDASTLHAQCLNTADRLHQEAEEARKRKDYEAAKEAMRNAKTEWQFRSAARAFSFMSSYEDAAVLRDRCLAEADAIKQAAELERKRKDYEAAKEAMRKASNSSEYRAAAKEFMLLASFEDASALYEQCRKEADRLKAIEDELAQKRKEYKDLIDGIAREKNNIETHKAWFGIGAKIRKESKIRLGFLQARLERDFPNGKPES